LEQSRFHGYKRRYSKGPWIGQAGERGLFSKNCIRVVTQRRLRMAIATAALLSETIVLCLPPRDDETESSAGCPPWRAAPLITHQGNRNWRASFELRCGWRKRSIDFGVPSWEGMGACVGGGFELRERGLPLNKGDFLSSDHV
jgi:hypothetical protein